MSPAKLGIQGEEEAGSEEFALSVSEACASARVREVLRGVLVASVVIGSGVVSLRSFRIWHRDLLSPSMGPAPSKSSPLFLGLNPNSPILGGPHTPFPNLKSLPLP